MVNAEEEYLCPDCQEQHETEEEAEECCESIRESNGDGKDSGFYFEIQDTLFICGNCGNSFVDETFAEECCKKQVEEDEIARCGSREEWKQEKALLKEKGKL